MGDFIMEYELFKMIYRLMNIFEDHITEDIGRINETEGQLDDFINFIECEYPNLRKYINLESIDERYAEELVGYAESLRDEAWWEGDTHFLDAYVVANYLAKRRPELIEKYLREWKISFIEALVDNDEIELGNEEDIENFDDSQIERVFDFARLRDFLVEYGITDDDVQTRYNFLDDFANQNVK